MGRMKKVIIYQGTKFIAKKVVYDYILPNYVKSGIFNLIFFIL